MKDSLQSLKVIAVSKSISPAVLGFIDQYYRLNSVAFDAGLASIRPTGDSRFDFFNIKKNIQTHKGSYNRSKYNFTFIKWYWLFHFLLGDD